MIENRYESNYISKLSGRKMEKKYTSKWKYDNHGRCIWYYRGDIEETVEIIYDDNDRRIEERINSDRLFDKIVKIIYDNNGNKIEVSVIYDLSDTIKYQYEYDKFGNMIKEVSLSDSE